MLSENPEPALGLLLLDAAVCFARGRGHGSGRGRGLAMSASTVMMAMFAFALEMLPLIRAHWPDLRHGSSQQHRVGADVLALHLPGSLEVIVSIREADEAVPLALFCSLVSYYSCLLYGWIL